MPYVGRQRRNPLGGLYDFVSAAVLDRVPTSRLRAKQYQLHPLGEDVFDPMFRSDRTQDKHIRALRFNTCLIAFEEIGEAALQEGVVVPELLFDACVAVRPRSRLIRTCCVLARSSIPAEQ
jgi:hypothetical protein